MLRLKDEIEIEFQPFMFSLFNKLGVVTQEEIEKLAVQEQEACQFINWESFQANMHKVFGIHHACFAKMFFSYLIDYKAITCVVNY